MLVAMVLLVFPAVLEEVVLVLPIPGVARIPTPGPTPPARSLVAARGDMPSGPVAFRGSYGGIEVGCAFLMELEDGRRLGVSAGHVSLVFPAPVAVEFLAPDGTLVAKMGAFLGRGGPFVQGQLAQDYALWLAPDGLSAEQMLRPDPRGQGEIGEGVWLFSRLDERRWPGVVIAATPQATWVQLEDSFSPLGFSGCPVVSRHTGRVIGMAVAGADRRPVVLGLHPAGSLVELAREALENPGK